MKAKKISSFILHPSSFSAAAPSRAVFFTASALVYTAAIVSATLTLNPYFSQTWDVNTFIHAARTLSDGRPFDLYAQTRAAQTWPYAYPPLHAFVVALALFIGDLTRVLPDYVWARAPVIAADIGVALVLFRIVLQKSNDETIARAAALVWLFNPITFYDTAAQGHFESAWLVFVLLAYVWFEDARPIALPALALALAVLFKQTALVFAIPLWIEILKAEIRRMKDEGKFSFHPSSFILHLFLFAIIIGAVCLPFLLYSDDFGYMNLTYVENVPVQTSSWIIALLGLTRAAPDALTSDFFLLRYQTSVTLLAAVVVAFVAARRGWSLYLAATLIAIAFFLTSKKVMGYYYVMLLPFLLAEILPRRRFDLASITIVATSYIALAPYYAAWTNHMHWWVYAALGTTNSLFFVWLFWQTTADRRSPTADPSTPLPSAIAQDSAQDAAVCRLRSAVMIALGLFTAATIAAWLQPLLPNNGSPIRAPLVAPGMETIALLMFAALIGLVVLALSVVRVLARLTDARALIAAGSIVLIFAPLFFSVYTLTKESTAILEIALKMLGV
ncbi:MAG: hypothetical protein AB1817_04170 [Chloroflexota bacterium]